MFLSLLVVLLPVSCTVIDYIVLIRWQSSNYPDRWIRHYDFELYTDVDDSSYVFQADSLFRQVGALNGELGHYSFESVNYPGHYIRHADSRLRIDAWIDDDTFKADASWLEISALNGVSGYVSYQSFNFPNHVIRHSSNALWLGEKSNDQLLREDASWNPTKSVVDVEWKYAPVLQFDRDAQSEGYPLSASETTRYYEVNVQTQNSQTMIENLDLTSSETFYEIQTCSSGYMIIYRWFYGFQHECMSGQGEHWADWEQVAVHMSANAVPTKVTFWQHGDWYTVPWDEVYKEEDYHVVVHVGKHAHGSYYDPNDIGGGCGYFYDYRDPEDESDNFRTWTRALNPIEEQVFYSYAGAWNWNDPSDPGISNSFAEDFCNTADCSGCGCSWRDCDDSWELISPQNVLPDELGGNGGCCIGMDLWAELYAAVEAATEAAVETAGEWFESASDISEDFWNDVGGSHDAVCDAFSWAVDCDDFDPPFDPCLGIFCAKSVSLNIANSPNTDIGQHPRNAININNAAMWAIFLIGLCALALTVVNIIVCVRRGKRFANDYDKVAMYDSQSQVESDAAI